MNINERIKMIRESLKETKTNFAKTIGYSQSNITRVENNEFEPKETMIKAICREFNVNEDWLRTGNGEMFNTSDDLIELFGYVLNDMSKPEKDFMLKYLSLSSNDRKMVVKYLNKLTSD